MEIIKSGEFDEVTLCKRTIMFIELEDGEQIDSK